MENIGFENVIGFMSFNNQKEEFVGAAKSFNDAKICVEMKDIDTLRNGVYFIDTQEGRYIYNGNRWYEPKNGKMDPKAIVYDVRKDMSGEDSEVSLEEVWDI